MICYQGRTELLKEFLAHLLSTECPYITNLNLEVSNYLGHKFLIWRLTIGKMNRKKSNKHIIIYLMKLELVIMKFIHSKTKETPLLKLRIMKNMITITTAKFFITT